MSAKFVSRNSLPTVDGACRVTHRRLPSFVFHIFFPYTTLSLVIFSLTALPQGTAPLEAPTGRWEVIDLPDREKREIKDV